MDKKSKNISTKVTSGDKKNRSEKGKPLSPPEKLKPQMLVGTVLDNRYRIDALLGEGGMGEVYRAEHIQIGRKVAIKVLHPLYSNEEEVLERFRREARAATAIGHPNIVDVTDSGTTPDGRAFFVMEVLEGMELADIIIDNKWMDPQRAAHVAIQVCQAVGAAHKAGIIHRDLKPENVFLITRDGEPDFVKILDFGIAKSTRMEMTSGGGLTQPGLAMGTPEYMAPEQAAGKPADERADIYAAGGLLYAMLVGRPPHEGSNIMEVLTLKATTMPQMPREIRPEIPEKLEAVIMKTLSRDPDLRHQSMEQLEYDLRKFVSGRGSAVAAILGLRLSEGSVDDMDFARSPSSVSGLHDFARSPSSVSGLYEFEAFLSKERRDSSFVELQNPPPEEVEPADIQVRTNQPELLKCLGKEENPPPPPETFERGDPEDFENFSQHTHTVIRKPGKGLGWMWALVVLVLTAAAVASLFFLQKRKETRKETERKALSTADGMQDATIEDIEEDHSIDLKLVDAVPEEDLEDTEKGEKKDPVLTDSEMSLFKDMAWRAAKKKRWTRPEKESLLYFISRLEEAEEAEEEIKKLRGYAKKNLYRSGRLNFRRKNHEKAEDAFRNLLALVPGDDDVKTGLVNVLVARANNALRKKKWADAEVFAGEAVSLDGDSSAARFVWARALEDGGRKQAALAEYEKILKNKKSTRALRNKSRASARKLRKTLAKEKKIKKQTERFFQKNEPDQFLPIINDWQVPPFHV